MPTGRQIDLLGFGIAAVDDVVELSEFPRPDSKAPVLSIERCGGGQCTTALVAAARLGMKPYYAGLLGRNELSEFTREVLKREGVGFPEETTYEEAQPYYSIILMDRSTGERTILYSGERVRGPGPQDIREELILAARMLFADQLGPEGTRHACQLARKHRIPIVADLERVDCDALRDVLELATDLIFPLRMGRELTGETDPAAALKQLARPGRNCTALTDGQRGCWFIAGDGLGTVEHQPAFPIRAVDTTGCGDVFHGAYAAARLCGTAVAAAIRFAAATAALKATRKGGQAGIPDRAAVESFLAAQRS